MLILTRKAGESIVIFLADGDTITVTVKQLSKSRAVIGIDADRKHEIYRDEIWKEESNV